VINNTTQPRAQTPILVGYYICKARVINNTTQPRAQTPILVGFARKSTFDCNYLIDLLHTTGVNLLCKVKEKLNNG